MNQPLGQQIGLAFGRLLEALVAVVPAVLVLVASLLLGVLVGAALRLVLRLLLRRVRRGREEILPGTRGFLRAAGLKASPDAVAQSASFWTAVVVALAVGVNALEPGELKSVLSAAVRFLPSLLGSALLFLVGLGAASVVRRSVLLGAVNAGLPWARPGARAAHAVVVAFFLALSLDHLGLGRSILVATYSIVAGGIVLALALAFGLGARDLARGYLEKKLRAEEEDTGIRHV